MSGHWAVANPDELDDHAKNLLVDTAWSLLEEEHGVDVKAWKMWKKHGGAASAAKAAAKSKGKGWGGRGKGRGGKGGKGGKGGVGSFARSVIRPST